MAKTDDEQERFASPDRPLSVEEQRQAALREAYEKDQATVQQKAEIIKERSGVELQKVIAAAGVEDDRVKALAVDLMAYRIAERGVTPGQMSPKDLVRLGDQSIEHAYKAYEAPQEQQGSALPVTDEQRHNPMLGIEPHRPNYGELRETHEQVATASATEQRLGAIAQGEPRNDVRAYSDEIWFNALDRYEDLTARLAEQGEHAIPAQQQTVADPLQPVEIQDHGPADTHDRVQAFLDAKRQQREAQAPTGQADRPEAAHEPPQPVEIRSMTTRNADRVEEYLQAKNLDREARKALLQELGRAAGREVNEQEGKEITRDQGGGQSL